MPRSRAKPAEQSERAEVGGGTPARPARTRRSAGRQAEPTSRQQISTTIKYVRDQLRKDAGLATDADRLPQLTWLLFLKILDDFEYAAEDERGAAYAPIVSPPYRWRDWAAVEDPTRQLKGPDLIGFVNDRLIPYLAARSGSGDHDLRTIVGTIFRGTDNRIRSGFILREVVDRLSTINFNASEDIHTISLFYESMLKEMRDAAGTSGEFYTPRPLVRFIVDRLDPKLGERVLDPACGTGGFLVETYERLKPKARSPEQRVRLQQSLIGIEKKAMPYLLAVTNILLHGIEHPNVVEENALAAKPLAGIQESERVDVVATNPPFGGEEERGVLNNFPQGLRTAETAILFFQYVMAMLKRPGGRCGIILPNGFLFGSGVAVEVKKRLLSRFNLHTIVRLPNGVFAPYTAIPTNVLFFEACAPDAEEPCTREVWYYELPLPEGRKQYTKTKPLTFEDFGPCVEWWNSRAEHEHAWRVPVDQILANDCNLDVKNPHVKTDVEHRPPEELIEAIVQKERRILEILEEIKLALGGVRH
ncbi:MAG: SAM-dependent DNA methyltransferase [Chloroflexi bacterium]|nr:SAM-dependent DNA methyltransferase [Chloroflexota bacterium]